MIQNAGYQDKGLRALQALEIKFHRAVEGRSTLNRVRKNDIRAASEVEEPAKSRLVVMSCVCHQIEYRGK